MFKYKAFYESKIQNLSNRLFVYNKVKKIKIIIKKMKTLFSKDIINKNILKNIQKLFNDSNILLSKYNSNYNSPKYSLIF